MQNKTQRKRSIAARISALNKIIKNAKDDGILQHPVRHNVEYDTREHNYRQRGGKSPDPTQLYGVGYPERKNTDLSVETYSRSLSTRYSPDRPGVQARRVSDGVYQDPITNKVYDWNEGFTSETGSKFYGGHVALQTDFSEQE